MNYLQNFIQVEDVKHFLVLAFVLIAGVTFIAKMIHTPDEHESFDHTKDNY